MDVCGMRQKKPRQTRQRGFLSYVARTRFNRFLDAIRLILPLPPGSVSKCKVTRRRAAAEPGTLVLLGVGLAMPSQELEAGRGTQFFAFTYWHSERLYRASI